MNCPKCNHHNEEGSKFCGDCGGDLAALVSEYDQPEAIVQYREVLIDFLGDLELEDYEEEELELVRGELKVTVAAHERLVEEMGGTTQAPASRVASTISGINDSSTLPKMALSLPIPGHSSG